MNRFETMTECYRAHLAAWGPPSLRNQPPIYVLVTNWMFTGVPFYSLELASALADAGHPIKILWDNAEVAFAKTYENEVAVLEAFIETLPHWMRPVRVHEHRDATLSPELQARLESNYWDNAVKASLSEAKATDVIAQGDRSDKDRFLAHASKVLRMLQDLPPGRVLLPGGIYGLSGIYRLCAEALRLPYSTYDTGIDSIFLAHNGCAAHFADFPDAFRRIAARLEADPRLAEQIEQEVLALLKSRMEGRDPLATQVRASLDTAESPCDVLVCLNNRADTAALGRERLFRSIADWLRQIGNWSLTRPDVRVCIRQHPHERFDWLPNEENYVLMLQSIDPIGKRLRLIPAESEENTYDLIRSAKVVLPYTSTVGIEAACMGKPVITCSECYYSTLGFVSAPEDAPSYFALIDKQLDGGFELDRASRRSALQALYIVLSHQHLPTVLDPGDCCDWAKTAPKDIWSEPAPRRMLRSLSTCEPLAAINFLASIDGEPDPHRTPGILERFTKWLAPGRGHDKVARDSSALL